MQSLITLNIHVVCSEEEAQRFKLNPQSVPNPTDVILTQVVEEELLDDKVDVVKLVTDRYKDVGI